MLTALRSWNIPTRLYFQLGLIVSFTVVLIAYSMTTLYKELLDIKINSSKDMVETIYSLVDAQYKLSQEGKISEEEAKQNALDIINTLRYENGGYYWVYDMDLNMVMHPIKPELNGQNLLGLNDVNDKAFHKEIQQTIRAEGEGHVEYFWPVPGSDQPVKKISYFKGFEPWRFILATGVYVQEAEAAYWSAASIKLLLGAIITLGIAFTAVLTSLSLALFCILLILCFMESTVLFW